MIAAASILTPLYLGAFFPVFDSLFSTQGIMVMLLCAYGVAMWMFLTSAPKVYTIMVSDLDVARRFYEGILQLPTADVPMHYYYNYEQTLGGVGGIDPMYMGAASPSAMGMSPVKEQEGLWYQLKKDTQLHIVSGASLGKRNQQRHVCFDKECLESVLLRVQSRRLKYKIRQEKPLNFLVKDWDDLVIEIAEVMS